MLARTMISSTLALSLAVGLGACMDRDRDEDAAAADSAALDTAAAPAAAPQQAAVTDAQIARIVLLANTADSANGELARKKGTSEQVKAFGRRMIQDHGGANKQVMQLAQQASLNPEDSDMSRMMQSMADSASQKLQGLSGKEFDRAYIDNEVMMHQHVLNDLDSNLIPNAQNAQLKQLLQAIRPTVDSHLQQAQQIQSAMGGQTAPTGQAPAGQPR